MGLLKDAGKNAGVEAVTAAGVAAKETVKLAGDEVGEALDRLHGNMTYAIKLAETVLLNNKIVISFRPPFKIEIEVARKTHAG